MTPKPLQPSKPLTHKHEELLSRQYLNDEAHEADQFLNTLIDNCKNGQVIHVDFI